MFTKVTYQIKNSGVNALNDNKLNGKIVFRAIVPNNQSLNVNGVEYQHYVEANIINGVLYDKDNNPFINILSSDSKDVNIFFYWQIVLYVDNYQVWIKNVSLPDGDFDLSKIGELPDIANTIYRFVDVNVPGGGSGGTDVTPSTLVAMNGLSLSKMDNKVIISIDDNVVNKLNAMYKKVYNTNDNIIDNKSFEADFIDLSNVFVSRGVWDSEVITNG